MRAVDWWFRSREDGRITLAQAPNPSLITFALAAVARRLIDPGGWPGTALAVVATLALVWWSVDEILRGVNPFRRVLGAVVLAATAVGLVAGA